MQNTFDSSLRSIYAFFDSLKTPQKRYMKQEEAIAFVCWYISKQDTYGTELMAYVKQELPGWQLSDTILYDALKFLDKNEMIARYSKGVSGRGRPRNMIKIPDDLPEAKRKHVDAFAKIWATQCLHEGSKNVPTT